MRHLQGFVEHVQGIGTNQIILITPPPVDEAARIRENKQVSNIVPLSTMPFNDAPCHLDVISIYKSEGSSM